MDYSGWNKLDFIVVISSLLNLTISGASILKGLKALRTMRALRPLRIISRNEGLKLAVDALFRAIPELGNVILITGITLLLFSILGINFFKGTFFYCQIQDKQYLELIKYEKDCLKYGGSW